MIAAVPLPRWRDLASLAGPAPDPAAVAAPWLQPGDRPLWFSRSAWALAGLARGWAERHGRLPRLWVPGQFCNGSLDPLRRAGVAPAFYPVTADLGPDWPGCEALARVAPPDLFLLVHTFGRPADTATAQAFCRRHGALLIEDCAHVLRPEAGIGAVGDAVLWSPHKLLAVPQGGLLVLRNDCPAAPAVGAAPSLRPWLAKRLVQKGVPARLLPRPRPGEFTDDPPAASLPDTPVLAPAALKLLAAASRRLDDVAISRRAIACRLLAVLAERTGWQALFDPAMITPYRLVMRCDRPEVAAARFRQYRAAGIPVESWPDLPPEVAAEPVRQAAALELRQTLLCFPVHQGVDAKALLARCAGLTD